MNTTELQAGIEKLICNQGHTVWVTLKFDFAQLHNITPTMMRNTLRAWNARMHRKLLGPKWQKKTDEQFRWDAFTEKVDTHAHFHVLAGVPMDDMSAFGVAAEEAWKSLKGTDKSDKGFHYDIVYDLYGVAKYVSKEFNGLSHINSWEFKNDR